MTASQSSLTFNAFVLSLAQTAAVHFGDRADATGTTGAPNLPAAQQIIDILALLEVKTRGNLSAEERQVLEQIVAGLHERYARATAAGNPSSGASSA